MQTNDEADLLSTGATRTVSDTQCEYADTSISHKILEVAIDCLGNVV